MADDFHEMDSRVMDEPSILDLGVLLAENAGIVIGGALVGAILAFLLALVLPRTYESTSLLKFTEADAAVMKSADVLMPANIVGRASGNSIRRRIIGGVMPSD